MELRTKHILAVGLVLTVVFLATLGWMAATFPPPEDATDWWTAAGGVATALATIGLVVVTGLLWGVTRDSAIATATSASAAQRAASAAERAAESAEKAHIAAEGTAKRQLRAYLIVDPSITIEISASREVTIEFKARNTGQTPAYNFSYQRRLRVVDEDVADSSFVSFSKNPSSHSSTLGQSSSEICAPSSPATLTEEEHQAYKSGDKEIIVSGCLFYEDTFKDNHYTNFSCRFYCRDGKYDSRWTSDGNDAT